MQPTKAVTPRVLFILKRREDYGQHPSYSQQGVSTGLWNSARFVSDMLNDNDIESKVVQVIDNNCIDREVTQYKPTHVIIEALWVVPSKFEVLTKLHPNIQWIIRLHSELPFVAGEGMALDWIQQYVHYKNVTISCNARRMYDEIRYMLREQCDLTLYEVNQLVSYLPNYYVDNVKLKRPKKPSNNRINVGCFGAIRPLKNHIAQAFAALKFANDLNRKLDFHVNVGRIEMKGDPVLRNLVALFDGLAQQGHKLHLHMWSPHEQFLEIVKSMDIGLQVSFTETFNIVAADMVANNIPVVVSSEINWVAPPYAAPTSTIDITKKMKWVWYLRCLYVAWNKCRLKRFCKMSQSRWVSYFSN